MTLVLKSNNAYAGSLSLSSIAEVSKSASDIYTEYAARVTADGGTVGDATACQAAITAALAGGYFYKSAFALSARWGRKVSGGTTITKLYNLVDASLDAISTSTVIDLDTTHFAWNSAKFDAVTDIFTLTSVNLNRTGNMGFVASTGDHSITTNAIGMRTTPAAEQWIWGDAGSGSMTINGVTKIAASPDFAVATGDAIGLMCEQSLGRFSIWREGVLRKIATNALTTLAANVTANVTIQVNSGTVYLNEIWYLNAATSDAVAACSFDVGARY